MAEPISRTIAFARIRRGPPNRRRCAHGVCRVRRERGRAADPGGAQAGAGRVRHRAEVLGTADARVPAAAFGALWLAVADELDDEFFGLDSRAHEGGQLRAAVPRAARPRHRRRRGARGAARLRPVPRRRAGRAGSRRRRARVCCCTTASPLPVRRFADETLLVMLHGLLCWLAGRRVPLRAGAFAWPRPAHAAEYRRMFGAALSFDAPTTSIEFDAALLGARAAPGAASLREFLRDAPQSVFLEAGGRGGLVGTCTTAAAARCRLAGRRGRGAGSGVSRW